MINLIVTAIVTVGLSLIKGALWLIGFLLRLITTVLRLLLSLLPVTGSALLLVSVYLVAVSFTGTDPLPPSFPYHPDRMPFMTSLGSLLLMVRDLRAAFPGLLGILVLVAAVILCVPVLLALLIAHAGIAILPVLVFLFAAELVVYLVYGILSRRSPFEQIRGRYYLLFPKQADKHYERTYHAWLKRHAEEFEDDTFGRGWDADRYRDGEEEYLERDPYSDADDRAALRDRRRRQRRMKRQDLRQRQIEDYYGEYDEEDDYPEEERYDDDGYDEEYDEGYDEEYEESYDDDYDEEPREERGSRRKGPFVDLEREEPSGGFDFFAGCRDRASVDRKYRSLVKLYHPDNQDGDTSALQEINAQYAEAKRRYS